MQDNAPKDEQTNPFGIKGLIEEAPGVWKLEGVENWQQDRPVDGLSPYTPFVQFCTFVCIGVVTNGFWLMVFWGQVSLGMNVLVASTLNYGLAVLLSYYANKRWTFRGPKGDATLIRYVAVYAAGAVVQAALLSQLHYGLGLDPLPSQIIVTAVMAVSLFLAVRAFVFNR